MEQHSDHSIPSGHSNAATMNIPTKPGNLARGIPPGFNVYSGSNDASLFSTSNDASLFSTSNDASLFSSSNAASLFSSSLPVLPNKEYSESGLCFSDDASSKLDKPGKDVEDKDPIEDLDLQGIEGLLPDEDELLAGIMDDDDLSGLPSQLEELEECDLFGSGGGMELDFDPTEGLTIGMARANISDAYLNNSIAHYSSPNGSGTVAGEHPFGEHPSRTLFVRNINSNVEDSELCSLFEQYGDIRTLYTACKHRGFVMVSYYDIRAARTAMHALQNKPLRRRKLDIHFSIPKDNPSEKDINQGTLVVFNLEPSVSNDDLRQIFGSYGEVKEIRETPHKRHHKFIEYYDVRAAEAALRALNRSDIAGKRIKLEPSRPGGVRRNLMQHMSQDPELDDIRSYRQKVGSPIINSPPGNWAHVGSPTDNGSFHAFNRSPNVQAVGPVAASHLPGLASILPPRMSNSVKIAPIGEDRCRINHGNQSFASNSLTNGFLFPHSFPDNRTCTTVNMSSSAGTSFGPTTSSGSGTGTLSGSQFLWGNPSPYPEHTHSSAWPASPMGHSLLPRGQGQGLSYANRHGSFLPPALHHVGSAPSGIHFEKHFGYFPESPEASFLGPSGKMAPIGRNEGSLLMSMSPRSSLGNSLSGNISENVSTGFRMISPRLCNMFPGPYPYSGPMCSGFEGLISRGHRFDNNMGQFDSKKHYQLDLEKIVSGKDTRTTLMIKNIPNKYTSKMLLAAIDEKHKSTYDFVYLPIDFKNKCNVGYAFINMMSPSHIISFYEAFNGKKWEKFNSEKVASLAYARIQGLEALKAHFQNSSLMNEDKRCRPIIFHAEGPEAVDKEPFPLNGTIFCPRHQDWSPLGTSPESTNQSSMARCSAEE